MASLAAIWRHPVKSLGREALAAVELAPGRTMPWDRVWALAHEATRFDFDRPAWSPCASFTIGAKAPDFPAVAARLDEAAGRVTLTHPRRPAITVNPDLPEEAAALVAWAEALVPPGRARPVRIARVPGRGLTDTDYPSVSVGNLASLRALSQRLGREIAPERFRLNLWIEGLAPFEELGWDGGTLRIGPAALRIVEPVRRCAATSSDPATGRIDLDMPAALERLYGHRNFGVYAEVAEGGRLCTGDPVLAP